MYQFKSFFRFGHDFFRLLLFSLSVVPRQCGHESPLEREVVLLPRHLRVEDGEDLVVAEDSDSFMKPPPLVRFGG